MLRGRRATCVAIVLASSVASCALVVSFDFDTGPRRFDVRGTVDGLEGSLALLSVNGSAPVEQGNGPFTLAGVITENASFAVTATATSHKCSVEGGAGVAQDRDVVEVAVHCTSTDATLVALTVSNASLSPSFAPDVHAYTASRFIVPIFSPLTTTVTATARSTSAKIVLGGVLLASGMPSAPIPVKVGESRQTVNVSAAEGIQERYELGISGVSNDYLKAESPQTNAYFGEAVAIDGDTLVVGAGSEGAAFAGAVYVFVRALGVWTQQAHIKASNTAASALFGVSVALSGDTLVVGSPGEASAAKGVGGNQTDVSAPNAGAAYVFVRSGTTWSQQAYLKASNTRTGTMFGQAVALSGSTLVVGSPLEASGAKGIGGNENDMSGGGSGAAYVFTRSGATWSQQAYVKASNTRVNSRFGGAVAVSGDTVAVGSMNEWSKSTGVGGDETDISAIGTGAVYVFARSGATWSQQAYIKASNARMFAEFGGSVALVGDTLAVGSAAESSKSSGVGGDQSDTSATGAGAAYVFTRAGTTWAQQAYVKASNPRAGGGFGSSVALTPAADTLAVGSRGESSSATGIDGNQASTTESGSGAVYAFRRSGATWSQGAYVKASNTRQGALFGIVALSASTLAVGAAGETSGSKGVGGDQTDKSVKFAGAAYVFGL